MTTMGMKEAEAAEVATLIARALRAAGDQAELSAVDQRVRQLAASFPPYPHDFAGHI
jgi:glycine/serine hydroxymethyltransferase